MYLSINGLWQCVFKAANVTTENRTANIDEFVYCGFVFITDIEEGKSRAHLLSWRGIRIIIDRYRVWYVSSIPAIFFLLFVHKEMRWDTNDMLYRWQCFIAVAAVVCWFKLADWIFEDEDKYISRMINNVGRSRGWWLILQKLTHGREKVL